MTDNSKLRKGYGGTSEQRQRGLQGDSFSENAPREPEELDAARGAPDNSGHVLTVHPLESDVEPEGGR
ncbi:hypothetical protein [Hyalangium rubrum]|uniref:Uncharacterized protein n=1 Tax=Hyalangium rubrum TaxID=3103134 RepID=A0ABU5H126_9BACT|nr:hypothetical protein [Hyalangium sp. s54d21]MDY7225805.1 hypothetical protein [Hyalangium sp. s54d21]